MGDVIIASGSVKVVGTSATVNVAGNFKDSTAAVDTLGAWEVSNTVFNGAVTQTIWAQSGYITSSITASGATLQSTGGLWINGSLTASGATAIFDVNAQQVTVLGNFVTQLNGRLKETDPANGDYLIVYADATFGGASTAGLLTHGVFWVLGDFNQVGGAPDAYAPDSTHTTKIGLVVIPSIRAPAGSAQANRARAGVPAAPPRPAADALASGPPPRDPRGKPMQLARMRVRGTGAARQLSVMNTSSPPLITFANPGGGAGTSHFGALNFLSGIYGLASNVYVAGQLISTGSGTKEFTSTSDQLITSRGANITSGVTFDNVRWLLVDGNLVSTLQDVTFQNISNTAGDQFTVQRTGNQPSCDCSSILQLDYWVFKTVPTTGHYIRAIDSDGSMPSVLNVNMSNPTPATNGGHVATDGIALINYWPATFDWTGNGQTNNWTDGLNWSTGFPPGQYDDVFIRSSAPTNPLMDISGSVHNLTIEAGKNIDHMCRNLYAYGNVVAPLDAEAVSDGECHYPLFLEGDGAVGGNTVVGWFGDVYIEGNYKVSGTGNQLIVARVLKVESSGNLTVNGGEVDVGGSGGTGHGQFYTSNTGTLTMNLPADQMFVGSDGAYFEGGSTAGLLTAGTLTLVNGFVQTELGIGAPDAFAPSGTHTTVFGGTSSAAFFGDPGSWLQNAIIGSAMELRSHVGVKGWLSHGTGTGALQIFASSSVPATPLLTVSGLNFGSAYAIGISNVMLKFIDGTANATFDNVTWSGFPTPFSMDVFTVARSDATALTFNGHNFAVTVDSTGHYLKNLGSANIHMATPTPSTVTTEITTSGGTITWPYP
jgi:hypothetical protein